MRTREGRRAALKAAREKLERERAAEVEAGEEVIEKVDLVLDRDQFEVRPEGRRAWLREASRQLEARRAQAPWPVPRSRQARLVRVEARELMELQHRPA